MRGVPWSRGSFVAGLFLIVGFVVGPVTAEGFPIRIDSTRDGTVYVQTVGSDDGYQWLSDRTPAVYPAEVGERVDVRVVANQGLFFRWEGNRQNLAGPANITIRMERRLAWERIALVGFTTTTLLIVILLKFRRRQELETAVVESEIVELKERVASAEKVGSLARTLGDFEVLSKLGTGAMGVVYKVRSDEGKIFAAKVPNEMDARVVREAEICASFESPHIVECYGLVKADPSFILFEYLEGVTLEEWLSERGQLEFYQVSVIIEPLLNALELAHDRGIFHRDIKPENIFVAQVDGQEVLKVMDFGLARAAAAARLTRTGHAMGTPLYASPEQLSGNKVDATADLYSLGVLIYRAVTGVLPWKEADPVALTLKKYQALPVEPIEYRADLPMAWNQLIVDLLQGDPQKRPASVAEVKRRWILGYRTLK